MNREEHLLSIVAEECNEVAQRASKALRFGLAEIQEGHTDHNLKRLLYEFNDLYAAISMVVPPGMPIIQPDMVRTKIDKIENFLKYSKECGTLNDR